MSKTKDIKIISAGRDELGEWNLKEIEGCGVSLFVYNYWDEGYDGSGLAVFKIGRKWGYVRLGHCSCYGPLEDFRTGVNMLFTKKELFKVLKADAELASIKEHL